MLLPALLAFAVAVVIICLELIQSKFPNTFVFALRSWAMYVYCLVYGLIAFAVVLLITPLRSSGAIKFEGLGTSNPWILALYIGISARALLHIRLFTLGSGTPIGLESIVHLFEPGLLNSMEQRHFDDLKAYVVAKVNRYPALTIDQIKLKLIANIRPSLDSKEIAALKVDINNAVTSEDAIIIFLTRFGRRAVDIRFP